MKDRSRRVRLEDAGSYPAAGMPWCLLHVKPGEFAVISKKADYPWLRHQLGENLSETNPPPVGNQKTSRVRNLKMHWSGNAKVRRGFGDMSQIGT